MHHLWKLFEWRSQQRLDLKVWELSNTITFTYGLCHVVQCLNVAWYFTAFHTMATNALNYVKNVHVSYIGEGSQMLGSESMSARLDLDTIIWIVLCLTMFQYCISYHSHIATELWKMSGCLLTTTFLRKDKIWICQDYTNLVAVLLVALHIWFGTFDLGSNDWFCYFVAISIINCVTAV